jgi:hypothetical protein
MTSTLVPDAFGMQMASPSSMPLLSWYIWLAIAIGAAVCICLVVLLVCVARRRKRQRDPHSPARMAIADNPSYFDVPSVGPSSELDTVELRSVTLSSVVPSTDPRECTHCDCVSTHAVTSYTAPMSLMRTVTNDGAMPVQPTALHTTSLISPRGQPTNYIGLPVGRDAVASPTQSTSPYSLLSTVVPARQSEYAKGFGDSAAPVPSIAGSAVVVPARSQIYASRSNVQASSNYGAPKPGATDNVYEQTSAPLSPYTSSSPASRPVEYGRLGAANRAVEDKY